MKQIYYVYAYLDTRKPGHFIYQNYKFEYEPFYIGKGRANRLYKHLLRRSIFPIAARHGQAVAEVQLHRGRIAEANRIRYAKCYWPQKYRTIA